MTGPDDRDQPYYGAARIKIAGGLVLAAIVLALLDPLPGYDVNLGLEVLFLSVASLMVGVEAIVSRIPR